MRAQDWADWLDSANHAPRFSVRGALLLVQGQPHPRVGWLLSQLRTHKLACWQEIAGALGTPPPPAGAGLERLMRWEVEQVRALPGEAFGRALSPTPPPAAAQGPGDQQQPTVAERLSLNVRHSLWLAGQIAALGQGAAQA